MRRQLDRGFTLMAALVMVVLVGGIASALLLASSNEHKTSDLGRVKMKATYLAEAGAEDAAHRIRSAIAQITTVPASTVLTVDGASVSSTITSIGPLRHETDSTGFRTAHQQYEIAAQVAYNKSLGRVIRTVEAEAAPIFQFLAFYNDDLEFFPGANATVNGRVHTNRDLYLGTGANLRMNSNYVHAAGQMYRHRKDDGSTPGGSVSVQVDGSTSMQSWSSSLESTDSGWAEDAQNLWNGTVQNGAMGVSVMETPTVGATDPGGYYNQNADLVIRDNTALFRGVDVTASLPAGTLTTTAIYDAREGRNVPLTSVDMAKLRTTAYYPSNGLMYATRTGNSAASPKGIQVKNGSELGGPLTLVSDAPVYVQGDYNTVAKKPASIIADAVNLLSNNWNNTKSSSSGLPGASATTYNFAMITGNQNTSGGAYNGGFENLPRFHENWTGVSARIRGSFVNLWRSRIADGNWVYGGNRYTAPTRDWDYDLDFNDPSKLPPFTPMAVSINRTVYEEGYRRQP